MDGVMLSKMLEFFPADTGRLSQLWVKDMFEIMWSFSSEINECNWRGESGPSGVYTFKWQLKKSDLLSPWDQLWEIWWISAGINPLRSSTREIAVTSENEVSVSQRRELRRYNLTNRPSHLLNGTNLRNNSCDLWPRYHEIYLCLLHGLCYLRCP